MAKLRGLGMQPKTPINISTIIIILKGLNLCNYNIFLLKNLSLLYYSLYSKYGIWEYFGINMYIICILYMGVILYVGYTIYACMHVIYMH